MYEADVVVLGSGASGLAAAASAASAGGEVVILEAGDRWGGTSAISGGGMWLPLTHWVPPGAEEDSVEEVLAYLDAEANFGESRDMMEAYLQLAPRVAEFLDAHTELHVEAMSRPDYRSNEHAKLWRAGEPSLFDPKPLGEWAQTVYEREPHVPIRTAETWGGIGFEPGQPYKTLPDDLAQRVEAGLWARGRALVGGLLASALSNGAELVLNCRATRPVVEDGRVVGVADDNGDVIARARRGVVLATGGFEWSDDLVGRFVKAPILGAMSPRTNRGDGLKIAMSVGAALRSMAEAWWTPVVELPGEREQPLYRLTQIERTRPGTIMVDGNGRRFLDEAANYQDAGRAMQSFSATSMSYDRVSAYIVFDEAYRRQHGVFQVTHNKGEQVPDEEWVISGSTITELAAKIGADEAVLRETIHTFNEAAVKGHDAEFQRGETVFDRFHGDPTRRGAGRALGELAEAPFHAIPIVNGVIGTNGGPEINEHAQVLDAWGEPIPGLYAAGNAAGNNFGLLYAGPGSTLGPAVTWGYAAGQDAMGGAGALAGAGASSRGASA